VISSVHLQKAVSYSEHRRMVDDLMAQNKTTGIDQSEIMLTYAKSNLLRMQNLEKSIVINTELETIIKQLNKKIIFVIITEPWCGDAAQNVPVFYFMEKLSDNIEVKILLRDENLVLMDQYLTNGGRAIPKVICLERETLKELFVWGPRPEQCQLLTMQLKEKNASLKEKGDAIHAWYDADKTQSMQKEIGELLRGI
jgi:Thioredoxin